MDAAIVETVLDQIAAGASLTAICGTGDIPSRRLVRKWLDDEEIRPRYLRAREWQADAHADKIMDWAAACAEGRMDPNAARVAIAASQWTAAKLRPAVYGDRLEVTGRDGGPIALSVVDDAELARRVALLLARASQAMLPPARELDGECQEIGAPHSEGDG